MYNIRVNNNDLNNQGVNVTKDAHQVNDMLELFAEELTEQHDYALPVSTNSTISTFGGCLGTVSTVSTV